MKLKNNIIEEKMKHYNVLGLSIALLENGQISGTENYGLLEAESDRQVNENSIFSACSISKFLTGILAIKLIKEENEILLIKGPRRGWEMPGVQVEEGESLKDAAIRETKKETGIDVEIIKFCGIFQNVRKSICNTLFLAKPVGGELITSSEGLDVGVFPIDKALEMVTVGNFR